ncbi:MBL fold metallo-hydrolase [Rhizobium sp. SG2393]|uniref:MBL fold metallo-hydrolase n=1 Tax=Rhizobium sp. SG2393 TaxID=3276279 RepID=UPI00366DE7DA
MAPAAQALAVEPGQYGAPMRVGDYTVTRLVDGIFNAPVSALTHPDGAAPVAAATAGFGEVIPVPVNAFLLEGPGGLSLIDCGTGSIWGPNFGHVPAALAALHVEPAAISRIFITHLHGDHAYGLVTDGLPRFPNAEVLVPETELAFYTDPAAREATPQARRGGFDVAAKLTATEGLRIQTIAPGSVGPAITCLPMPGHTPGHAAYRIGEGEGALLLWGDVLHLEALQPQDPALSLVYDLALATGQESRRAALALAADEGLVVSGGHIDGFRWVSREGEAFRMSPASLTG